MSAQQRNISFFGSAFYIFSGRFFNNVAVLVVMFFFTRHFSTTVYGIYSGLSSLLNFFTIIAGISLPLFTLVYPPERLLSFFRSFNRKHYLGYGLMMLCCALLFALLQYRDIPDWYLLTLFFILFTAGNISDACLIALKHHPWLALINLVYALMFVGIHLSVLQLSMPFSTLISYWILILLLKIGFSLLIFRKGLTTSSALQQDFGNKQQMLSLWKHLYITDIIQVSFLWVDKFLIFFLASKDTMAIYYNGTLQLPFIMTVFSAVSNAAIQILANQQDKKIQVHMVKTVGKVLSSIMFPAFIYLMFFGEALFLFFFSEKYLPAVPVFICSVMILPLRAYNFSMLLQKNEKGRIITIGAVGDLIIALLLMYPLYHFFGLPGLALSFVISTLCQSAFYAYYTSKIMDVPMARLFPLKNWMVKTLLFLALCGSLQYLQVTLPFLPQFLTAGIIVAIVGILIFLWEFKHIRSVSL